jgi:MerR family transcriptional regulator, light-induced transcriptional regulator
MHKVFIQWRDGQGHPDPPMSARGESMPRPARFTIRAASALTGINQNTLRAWERRHALIQPERTPKGYRLFSDDDIVRLRLIQRALQEGVSIGRVRDYLEAPGTVEHLMADPALPTATSTRSSRLVEVSLAGVGLNGTTTIRIPGDPRPSGAETPLVAFVEQFEQAALRLDRPALERAFGLAVGLYSLRQAFYHALAPALARVGQRYLDDPADVGAEHFLTAFAHEKLLGALAGLRPLHQQPRALFACLRGEQHDIMLMLLSLEVGLEGVSALYLGADTPVEAIQHAAGAAGSRAVAVSATLAVPQETVLELRDRLAGLPRRPRLLIGGPAAWKNREWLDANGVEVLPLEPAEAGAQVLRVIGRA